jgi:NADH-quinone oxidoreductase subunit N
MAINSIIGAYYYFRLIVVMYMREPSTEAGTVAPVAVGFPLTVNVVLAVTAVGTVYFGLFPNQVLNYVLQSNLLGH